MRIIRSQHNDVYADLQRIGINRNIIDLLVGFIIDFTINQEGTNLQPPGPGPGQGWSQWESEELLQQLPPLLLGSQIVWMYLRGVQTIHCGIFGGMATDGAIGKALEAV